MKTGKTWGTTTVLFETPFVAMHWLSIKPNKQCSLHHHAQKNNAFMVLTGKLFIDVYKAAYPLVDTTELGPGDVMEVPPGEDHRFRTGDAPCTAIEIYYPSPLSEDIVRKDVGGDAPVAR